MLIGIAAAWPAGGAAQGGIARQLERLLDRGPYNRASWGVLVVNQRGQTVYERGDPGFGPHCYGPDTLVAGVCDGMWTRMDTLADSLAARGVSEVAGAIVGDGSYFDGTLVHPEWQGYDLNWWYAAPVSGLGFNDNSVNIT